MTASWNRQRQRLPDLKRLFWLLVVGLLSSHTVSSAELNVLFLGDRGPHRPRERFRQVAPVLKHRGIRVDYTDDITAVTLNHLSHYDTLLLYANIDRIEPPLEQALLDYVADGGGFVAIHCASYSFRNSPKMIALIGAQFRSHGTGVFRTQIAVPDHPIMRGFGGFESWDETYVHHRHNDQARTVLSYRVDGETREPWTWVRTHGKGRVFYTAWGHDERTWGHAGFQNLLERGIRWAAGDDPTVAPTYMAERFFPLPEINPLAVDRPPFQYVDVGPKIPHYPPGKQWGVQAEPLTRMQRPLAPGQSMQHAVVPRGFHLELFASESLIEGKPIAMAWDEQGRLWICETIDYPNELHPPGKGRDRIRVLEDTDSDGTADRSFVFADHLSIPTALTFYRGGVIVQDSTETVYLKDTDGDGQADQRTTLFAGWNMRDTHGGVSHFCYGLDNWIWAMQGYNASTPSIGGRATQSFRQGFFRFRPDGSALEFIRSTNNNTWGLGITEEGIVFGSTANRNPSVYMPIPNRYYERVRGWTPSLQLGSIADTHGFRPITSRVRQVDHHGGYTAGAGHAIYTARRYPQAFWNRTAFVNGPTGHLVGTFLLSPNGSGFRSTSPFNLFASEDEWTAPIMAEVGPDGNVWIVDWYNYIVQHNPTPHGFKTGKGRAYESDLRDKRRGRIYRVVYDDAPAVTRAPVNLARATPAQLVSTLRHTNMLWRLHAQRLLVERGSSDVVPALVSLIQSPTLDAIGLDVGAIHALWTLHGLGQLSGDNPQVTRVAIAALRHASAGVRRNAVQVVPRTEEATRALLDAKVLTDVDAQVRLMAFLALSDRPATDGIGVALWSAVQYPPNASDRWIPEAATCAAAMHAAPFLLAATKTREPVASRVLQIVEIVAEHDARGDQPTSIHPVLPRLAHAHPLVAAAVIRGWERGWATGGKTSPAKRIVERCIPELLAHLPPSEQLPLARLARRWGVDAIDGAMRQVADSLLAKMNDTKLDATSRRAAARELLTLDPTAPEATEHVLRLVTPQADPAFSRSLVRLLRLSRSPETGQAMIDHIRHFTPGDRHEAIQVLLTHAEWTKALLAALDDGTIHLSEIALDQKQTLLTHPNDAVRNRARAIFRRGGAVPDPDRAAVIRGLLADVTAAGNWEAGKQVYLKHCSKCHVHGTDGTRIGPDLTGMSVHPKSELLIHIIDPNRNVESNYRVYLVLTTEGRVHSGLLAAESKTTIELFDAEGKRIVLLRDEIEQLVASSKSLMPEGFEKQISREELRDLLEFLTRRERFVPINLSKYATIASDRGMFYRRDAQVERLVFARWGIQTFEGIPFHVTDPRDGQRPNVILLHSPVGAVAARMPRSVRLPCHGPARLIHLLSGVSGWGFPATREHSVSLIVRLHYQDGTTEDHPFENGVHFADYIRRVDVPQSKFAFRLRDQQIRYVSVEPKKKGVIEEIELIKGNDRTAPVIMAVTIETR